MKYTVSESTMLAEREKDLNILLENIDLIFSRSYMITNFPDTSRLTINTASIVCSPVLIQYIPLGQLVTLWKKQKLTARCPECSGSALVVGAVCVDSSDLYAWHGICPACKKQVNGTVRLYEVWGQALKSKTMNKKKHPGTLEEVVAILKREEHTENEHKLFVDNLDMILSKQEMILNDPKLYCCTIGKAYIGASFTGCQRIFLGALLELWQKNVLTDVCAECGGRVVICGAGGSILSGCHQWHGICTACKKLQYGHKERFYHLYMPVYKHVKKFNVRDAYDLQEVLDILKT